MYLFSRTARLVPGNQVASIAWAMNVTEKVNQIAEIDISLWTRIFSPGVGVITWTALVDDLSLLEATDAKLMADTGFQMLVDEGAKSLGSEGLNDRIAQFVTPYTAPPANAAPPDYASVITASIVSGSTSKAIDLGIKLAERGSEVTGLEVGFLTAATGPYGQVQWMDVCQTVQQLQAAQEAVAGDAKLLELLDKTGGVFNPGQQIVLRRLA